MAEVGTYYITIMPSMNKFTKAINESMKGVGQSASDSFSGGFLDVLKGSAIGTMLGNAATALGNQILDGLDVGIKRLDTIKNFPRVMEALGYSTKDADAAVKLIMEHLDGLPTSTQDMVSLTQAIADSTGDLDLATRAALGFNDMMLANGASAGEMTQAMGVFNRVLGKGNATTAQWMSLQSVMPAQLAMVARELLGEGASVEELRDKLNDGEVSWNDFLRAIVKLDEEGTGHIASFAEQARANSDGIGTAIANVQNRIGAGWAEILDVFGKSNISGAIDKFSYGIRNAMYGVADAFRWLKYTILGTQIDESVSKIFENIKSAIGGFDFSGLKDIARAFIDLIDGALKWIADHGDAIGTTLAAIAGAWAGAKVVTGIMAAVAAFKTLAGALSLMSGLADLPVALTLIGEAGGPLAGMFTALGSALTFLAANPIVLVIAGISALVAALVWWFTKTEEGQQAWQNFCTIMSDLWTGLQEDWASMCDVLAREWESFQAFIDGIPAWWQGICDYWTSAMDEQAENFRIAWEKIKSDFSEAWEAIKTAAIEKWEAIKSSVSSTAESIRSGLSDKWSQIRSALASIGDSIKSSISEKWDAIKSNVASVSESIRQGISDKWNSIKQSVGNTVDSIKTRVSDGLSSAKEAALTAFESLRSGIVNKVRSAYDTLSGIVSSIKSLFNFSWSLPRPRLPHINWHTESILGLLSIPVFDGISWYAKGGLFTGPTLAGLGEAGDEVALPLNDGVYTRIAKGITDQMDGTPGQAGQIIITGNTFNVRDDEDVERIAEQLATLIAREMGAAA